jgi:hypothetical protein
MEDKKDPMGRMGLGIVGTFLDQMLTIPRSPS